MQDTFTVALAALLSFLLSGLATLYARRLGLLDHPGERHSHHVPTPRGGGAGLIAALLLVSLLAFPGETPRVWAWCVAPGVAVLALTGWWDDHRSLSARLRFLVQLAVSISMLWCSGVYAWTFGAPALLLAALFLVWMTNLNNFMDGSNGMAGLQGVFAGGTLAWLYHAAGDEAFALLSLVLAAACMGFLPWNLGRARVFMGDVGSMALGFAIAALLLHGVGSGAFRLPVAWLVMLVFLTDATLTLLARVLRGERWYNAHRQHLYQRLIANGWTHGRVALFYQAVNLVMVLPAIVVAANMPALAWPLALGITIVFALGWWVLKKNFGVLAQAG
jgi:Fuc2NAc and GlcNAc transferase